jgi:hypothetical protein
MCQFPVLKRGILIRVLTYNLPLNLPYNIKTLELITDCVTFMCYFGFF